MIIQKAFDSLQKPYFALHIEKDSRELEIIRSFPVRFWNKEQKVWIIPYSTDNWNLIKHRFSDTKYQISEDIIQVEAFAKNKAKTSVKQAIKREYTLSVGQQNALNSVCKKTACY
jgi:hypothetical protein